MSHVIHMISYDVYIQSPLDPKFCPDWSPPNNILARRFAGPQLVVPRDRPQVPIGYKSIHEWMPGKLVEHHSPQEAPGRQKIRNHGDLVQFGDVDGWFSYIFVGFDGMIVGDDGFMMGFIRI